MNCGEAQYFVDVLLDLIDAWKRLMSEKQREDYHDEDWNHRKARLACRIPKVLKQLQNEINRAPKSTVQEKKTWAAWCCKEIFLRAVVKLMCEEHEILDMKTLMSVDRVVCMQDKLQLVVEESLPVIESQKASQHPANEDTLLPVLRGNLELRIAECTDIVAEDPSSLSNTSWQNLSLSVKRQAQFYLNFAADFALQVGSECGVGKTSGDRCASTQTESVECSAAVQSPVDALIMADRSVGCSSNASPDRSPKNDSDQKSTKISSSSRCSLM